MLGLYCIEMARLHSRARNHNDVLRPCLPYFDSSSRRPHARLLLPAVKRALEGASKASFPAAAVAAIEVVGRLEGANPYAQPYHEVMTSESCLSSEGPRADQWGHLQRCDVRYNQQAGGSWR